MKRVTIALGTRAYDVVVGSGAIDELSTVLAGRKRAVVVTQEAIRSHSARVEAALDRAGIAHTTLTIGDGEEHKTIDTIAALASACAGWGLLRGDAVVAVGGGVVGDVAGFLAAAYYRGVAVVQVPTTLLAMVDSAIGGKTGVNLPEGKNLVGAFHQPLAVLADPSVLGTLPEREFRCGLAEVAKYAFIGDEPLRALLCERTAAIIEREPEVLADVVARCAADKARVVEADEHEQSGVRAVLNYGHTLGHALETAGGHALLHGEAVAIGMVFAVRLASALERVYAANIDSTVDLLQRFGLPTEVLGLSVTTDEVLELMRRDKKADGGLTFMLPGPNGIERVDDPDPTAVAKALAQVGIA